MVNASRLGKGQILANLGLMLLCLIVLPLPGALFPNSDLNPAFDPLDGILLYERANSEIHSGESVELVFVGDIMLGRGILESNKPFKHAARALASADLAIGNFEGAITNDPGDNSYPSGDDPTLPIRLIAPPSAAQELQTAGFDLLSLGNNHSLDCGAEGLEFTARSLKRAGIGLVGAGPGEWAAYMPAVRELHDIRIAIFGFNAVRQPVDPEHSSEPQDWQTAKWDLEHISESIRFARMDSDVVVVLVHWGDEYETRASPGQTNGARELIEMGADIVIGSHPHVMQQTEVIEVDGGGETRTGFIAYSLGNFVFDQSDPRTEHGLALRITLDKQGLAAVKALAVEAGPMPRITTGPDSEKILARIRPKPAPVTYRCSVGGCDEVESGQETGTGLFNAGRTDLTGDGVAETIVLRNERIQIFQDDRLGWESPPDWTILDAALGDPNGDGRQEVVLAVLKPDEQGELKSHPFLIGYRGGIYRQVWGGSAVHYPLREIDLIDIDRDGTPELVVLEKRAENRLAVTLWRWQGWVFSQVWSSPEWSYENLSSFYEHDGAAYIQVGKNW